MSAKRAMSVAAWLVGLSVAARAETLIYEGTVSVELDADTQLLFSLCIEGVCAPPQPAELLGQQGPDGRFTYEIQGITRGLAADATHLRVELEDEGSRTELAQQPMSRALFQTGCRPAPTEALQVGVGARYPTIQAALASLDDVCIPAGERVEIRVAPGNYVLSEPIRITHRDGARIHIIGAGADVDGTILVADEQAFIVDRGHYLGRLHNLLIVGRSDPAAQYAAVLAQRGGSIEMGETVRIQGTFRYGLLAVDGGVITAHRVQVQSDGDGEVSPDCTGILATSGGRIYADGATVEGCAHGVAAEDGGLVIADNARAKENAGDGFSARNGAVLINRRVGGADGVANCDTAEDGEGCGGAYENAGAGFVCEDGATVIASNTAARENRVGYQADACVMVGAGGESVENETDGALASNGAIMKLERTRFLSNGRHGISAINGAHAIATGAFVDDSTEIGVYATASSFILASNARVINCEGSGFESTYWGKILASGGLSEGNAVGYRANAGGRNAGGDAGNNDGDDFVPPRMPFDGTNQP